MIAKIAISAASILPALSVVINLIELICDPDEINRQTLSAIDTFGHINIREREHGLFR